MRFFTLTIFPEMLSSFLAHGIIKRAIASGRIAVPVINIRDFAEDRHQTTDDRPFGGGAGMVMKAAPLAGAIQAARKAAPAGRTILFSPQGRVFDQALARELAQEPDLILVCGRYEGVDERVYDLIDEELSIGDFVLTGGEPAAMVVIDAVARLLPGVLGKAASARHDSFSDDLLEHAHYTRPRVFRGEAVPEVLLSGNHQEITGWRREMSLVRTFLKRPDLLQKRALTREETEILKRWCRDIEALVRAQSLHCADPLSGG